jgi:SAM-dependent methyltransferase
MQSKYFHALKIPFAEGEKVVPPRTCLGGRLAYPAVVVAARRAPRFATPRWSLYRRMTTEHLPARHFGHVAPVADWVGSAAAGQASPSSLDWAPLTTIESPRPPIDETLIEVASDLNPGKALDLGCGSGQNAVWLAQRGWVVTAVDISPGAITEAKGSAAAAGVSIAFDVADITSWRPASRFDLVICTFAVPARGMGRSRVLEMAASAVAPGGAILVTELDVALARDGRMAEKHLVSTEEIERHLDGFRVERSRTRLARRPHGYEEIVLPVATVVATRRTDLRSPY